MFDVKELFQKSELIPVIVQDIHTHQVLMLGFANEEAVRKTFETRTAWFWSRSRKNGLKRFKGECGNWGSAWMRGASTRSAFPGT